MSHAIPFDWCLTLTCSAKLYLVRKGGWEHLTHLYFFFNGVASGCVDDLLLVSILPLATAIDVLATGTNAGGGMAGPGAVICV